MQKNIGTHRRFFQQVKNIQHFLLTRKQNRSRVRSKIVSITNNPLFVDALGYHEALRALGFHPDNIYMLIRGGVIQIVLIAQSREFTINVGEMKGHADEELKGAWTMAVNAWNTATDDARATIWTLTLKRLSMTAFVTALKNKGFILPIDLSSKE